MGTLKMRRKNKRRIAVIALGTGVALAFVVAIFGVYWFELRSDRVDTETIEPLPMDWRVVLRKELATSGARNTYMVIEAPRSVPSDEIVSNFAEHLARKRWLVFKEALGWTVMAARNQDDTIVYLGLAQDYLKELARDPLEGFAPQYVAAAVEKASRPLLLAVFEPAPH